MIRARNCDYCFVCFSVFELNAVVLGFRIEMRVFVNGDSGSVVWNVPRSCCFVLYFLFLLEIFGGFGCAPSILH